MRLFSALTLCLLLLLGSTSFVLSAPPSSGDNRIELHPALKPYDLTHGQGYQHNSMAEIHKIYEEVLDLEKLFFAARESDSHPQILKIADKMIPELHEKNTDTCNPINMEAENIDTNSMMLRNKVKDLNERHSQSAMAGSSGLMKELSEAATALRDSEEKFLRVKTVQHICVQSMMKLDQMRGEAGYAKQAMKEKGYSTDL